MTQQPSNPNTPPTTYPVHLKRRVNTTYECTLGEGKHTSSTFTAHTLPQLIQRLIQCKFTQDMPITITRVERHPEAQGTYASVLKQLAPKHKPSP